MSNEQLPDKNLSHYRIISKLGTGGMGEVYLAQDTNLDRKVALKVLPADVASKRDRMERFVREAKAAAALNHPNIAHVYEIGESDSTHYIVMEFIDGATLRSKIHKEKVPLSKLLKYLNQVAEGLAKAHAGGIVHRDLKPDNIMITRDGDAKILDFGLAKLIERQGEREMGRLGEDPTIAHSHFPSPRLPVVPLASTPGMIMGTVGYMSPEQAQGIDIDQRSDIFSFGCILFEAVTGYMAFAGKDAIESLNKIIREPVAPISDFRPDTPNHLQRIVRRCLAKDREDRYQTIKDVAIELRELRHELAAEVGLDVTATPASSGEQATAILPDTGAGSRSATAGVIHTTDGTRDLPKQMLLRDRKSRFGIWLILGAVLVVAVLAGAAWYLFQRKAEKPGANMQMSKLVTGLKGTPGDVSISRDGKYVVYSVTQDGKAGLWLRQVSQETSIQIVPPAEGIDFRGTTFSPEGEVIYYVTTPQETDTRGTLYSVPVLGGKEPKKLKENVDGRITLSPDGRQFAFIRWNVEKARSDLVVANSDGGGEDRNIATRSGNDWFEGLAWSPDGKRIACGSATITGGLSASLVTIPVDGGPPTPVGSHKFGNVINSMNWLNDGSGLVVTAAKTVTPNRIVWYVSYPDGNVEQITRDMNSYGDVGLTADNSTAVMSILQRSSKVWVVGPDGGARKITNGPNDGAAGIAYFPDGRLIYSALVNDDLNLWVVNADGSGAKAITSGANGAMYPVVSLDGNTVFFDSFRPDNVSHIWRMNADGSGLTQLTFAIDFWPVLSRDGKWIVFTAQRGDTGKDSIWKVPIEGGEAKRVSDLQAHTPASFTVDGKRMMCRVLDMSSQPPRERPALIDVETGKLVEYLDLPTSADELALSPDGKQIFYVDTRDGIDNLWAKPVGEGQPKQMTKFTDSYLGPFAIAPDGRSFALSRIESTNEIVLVKNFR